MKTACHILIILLCFSGMVQADFESDVIELVNEERAARGLKPLSYDAGLTAAAEAHSQDMGSRDYFDHDSLDGTKFYERIIDEGYSYNQCGENIAAGQMTPEQVVSTWMNSDGHRANILHPDFCDIGVGYANVDGSSYTHYWTQDFGRRTGVFECPDVATPPPGSSDVPENPSPATDAVSSGCFIESTGTTASTIPLWITGLILLGLHFEKFILCQLKKTASTFNSFKKYLSDLRK